MRIFKALFLLFAFVVSLNASSVTVAAAANVSYAMKALATAFSKEQRGVHVRVIVGSSGKLTAQIRNGAPFDVFLSADMRYPKALFKEGAAQQPPVVYAQGALALLSTKRVDLLRGLEVLLQPTIKRIAVANPKTAPYGKAAREALQNAALYERLKHKFIFGESVSQTLSYTLKAADAGLVAKSALYAPSMRLRFKKGRDWIEVDATLYTPIKQGMVLLQRGAHNADAKAFFDFMQSPQAKKILKEYGYRVDE